MYKKNKHITFTINKEIKLILENTICAETSNGTSCYFRKAVIEKLILDYPEEEDFIRNEYINFLKRH